MVANLHSTARPGPLRLGHSVGGAIAQDAPCTCRATPTSPPATPTPNDNAPQPSPNQPRRHPNYILAAYIASGTRTRCPADERSRAMHGEPEGAFLTTKINDGYRTKSGAASNVTRSGSVEFLRGLAVIEFRRSSLMSMASPRICIEIDVGERPTMSRVARIWLNFDRRILLYRAAALATPLVSAAA